MSAATKVAALVVTLRVLVDRVPRPGGPLDDRGRRASPCVSLAVGNLAALVQRNVKRLLAYSSISHAGFMLIAIAANNELGARALLYYLDPLRRDVDRRVRRRRRARARARRAGDARQPRAASAGSGRSSASRCGSSCSASPASRSPAASSAKFYVFSAAYERGLVVADRRRRRRDAGLALLLPRRRAGDVHARRRGAAARAVAGGSPPRDPLLAGRRRLRSSSRSARSSPCSR